MYITVRCIVDEISLTARYEYRPQQYVEFGGVVTFDIRINYFPFGS